MAFFYPVLIVNIFPFSFKHIINNAYSSDYLPITSLSQIWN